MTGPGTAVPPAARRAVVAVLAALLVTVLGYAVSATAAQAEDEATLGPGLVTVRMDLEHSAFLPSRLQVREGTTVRFEVINDDPIHHELVVGSPEVHAHHRHGTERVHPPVPGEVSVGPNGRGLTFYTFDEPGTVAFACHLPGHLEYGMEGVVEVVPS